MTTSDYNPSVRIIDLLSHNTYVECVNFILSGWTYSLKPTPNDKLFEKSFMAILFTLIAEKIIFVFYFDTWPGG